MPRYAGSGHGVAYQAASELPFTIRQPGDQLKKVLIAVARSGDDDVARF
jgi:hypothetical protein